MAGNRALLAALLALCCAGATGVVQPFTYPYAACAPSHGSGPVVDTVAVGDTVYVCVNINGVVTSFFNLRVDEFSAISLQGSNYALPTGAGFLRDGGGWQSNLTFNASVPMTFYSVFDIAVARAFSPLPRLYKRISYRPTLDGAAVARITTVPIWTAIVKVDNGVVSEIGWDDGCFFCAANGASCVDSAVDANTTVTRPIEGTAFRSCSNTHDECYPTTRPAVNGTVAANANASSSNVTTSQLTESACDLKIFVTWTGTDKNGAFLRSANKRFSRYRSFGIATAYQSALNLAADGLNLANSAISSVQAVPGRVVPASGVGGSEFGRRLAEAGEEGTEEGAPVLVAAAEAVVDAEGAPQEPRRVTILELAVRGLRALFGLFAREGSPA